MQRRFGSEHSEFMMDDSVLAVYVEPLLAERRVVFVGDARTEALTRVASVAARVLAFDTSPEALSQRLPNGRVEPYDPIEVEALEGPFDIVFVADVGSLGPSLEYRLDDFARLVGRRGHVVLGLSAVGPLHYEDLWDLLAVRFDVVRMAGAAAMTAHAIAELGEGEATGVVVDGSLVSRPARTDAFVALCGQTDVALEGYVIVQVDPPNGRSASDGARAAKGGPSPSPATATAAATNVAERDRANALEKKANALAAELAERALEVAATRTERDAFREDRKRLEKDLRDARDATVRVQRAATQLEESARSAPSADDLRKLEDLVAERAERVQELENEVERRGRLVRELVEETRERTGVAHVADPIELDRALERALRAEAERAEAQFLADELRARVSESTDAGLDALRSREAELAGRARGLRARLAETEEHVGVLHAALDKKSAESEAGAANETRVGALVASERGLSTQVGTLTAQLMMSRERELESRAARDLARGENLALVAQVAALETQHRELRDRLVQSLDRLAGGNSDSGSVESALLAVDTTIDLLRGERNGLRMRLDALEASVVALRGAPQTAAVTVTVAEPMPSTSESIPPIVGANQGGESELELLRLENQALTADLAEAKAAHRKASDLSLATRDALVERLQLELADHERRTSETIERERTATAEVTRLREALVDAATSVDGSEELTLRLATVERDLHDAIGAAERAAADARGTATTAAAAEARFRGELAAAERRAAAAEAALATTRSALDETRAVLEELRHAADASRNSSGRRASDLAADEDHDRGQHGQHGNHDDADGDKDLLLRSLAAQIEDRDDRIHALERRLSGTAEAAVGDEETLRRELLDLQERAARLTDELRVERDARRVAEERSAAGLGTAAIASGRELERRAESQTRALEEAMVRVEGYERDVRALRDVFTETRNSLEHLLGAASGAGDPEVASRIGELLTLLGRY